MGRDAQSHSEGSRNEGAAHSAHSSTATEGDVHGAASRRPRRPPRTRRLLLNGLLLAGAGCRLCPAGEACTYRPSSRFQINWLIFTLSGDRRFQHAGNRRSQVANKRHVPESRSHGIQHAWRGPAGRARFRVWGHAPCVISLDRQRAALFATGTHPLDLPSRFACGSAAAVHARERACIRCKGAENARRRGRLEPPRLSSASQTEEDLGLLRHHRRRSAVYLI